MTFENLDLEILKVINHTTIPELNIIFVLTAYSIYPFLFFIAYYFYRKKEKKIFSHLIISFLIGFIFVSAIKYIIDRPRPYIDNPGIIQNIISLSDPSFPSRHTFTAFLLMKFIPKKISKFLRQGILFYLLLIPLSMMYIGVHYPTDILGGIFIGLLTPTLISEKISTKISDKILSFNIRKFVQAS